MCFRKDDPLTEVKNIDKNIKAYTIINVPTMFKL